MAHEQTLVLVKPDGVQRGLIGHVIERLERTGLKIVGMKMLQLSEELASEHYGEHRDKPFYAGLVSFITSSPVVAMTVAGPEAVSIVRKIMGSTRPVDAVPGTIRGDLATDVGRNLVHGSASLEDASREVALFFDKSELVSYQRAADPWIVEPAS